MLLLVCLRVGPGFHFLDLYKECYIRLTSVYSPKSALHTIFLFFFKQVILSRSQVSCFNVPVGLAPSNVPSLKTVYEINLEENELLWTVSW